MGVGAQLPAALARFGLTVELVPGWETRSAGSFNPRGSVAHHTAGPKTGDRPSLNVCVNGRPGLPGPLCNVFLARSGVAIVVAAGRANHAGTGGWKGLTGNSSVFGTEAEDDGDGNWTAAQLKAFPRIHAAYHSLMGTGADMCCAHREWATPPGRKPDPTGIDMPSFRAEVGALLANPPGADDMDEADHQRIVDNMRTVIQQETAAAVWKLNQNFVERLDAEGKVVQVPALQELANIGTAVQRANATAAIAVKLIGDSELNDLTADQVKAAMEAVLDERFPPAAGAAGPLG